MKKTNVTKVKMGGILTLVFATFISLTSCKKDNNTSSADTISDDEVAEAVTQSVSASSGGMVSQNEGIVQMASATSLSCGYSNDTTIIGASASGATITYNYNLHYTRSVTCTNGIPSQYNASFNGSSSYTTLRMSSNDATTAQLTVTGLDPAASNYVINGNYVRNGTQQSNIRNQHSFSSTLTYTATDIVVNKATKKTVSGTATVQFSGTGSAGAKVSRGGTLTFLGNNKATLVLNNGGTYTIQW